MGKKKRGWSKKVKGWLGTYIQHYDARGRKSGTSERKKGWLGVYTQHYKASGKKAGTSETKEDWRGTYTQKYNAAGKKSGTSEKKENWLEGKYTQHYDSQGRATDRSEKKTGVLSGTYVERYGEPSEKRYGNTGSSSSSYPSDSSSWSPGETTPAQNVEAHGSGSTLGWVLVLVFLAAVGSRLLKLRESREPTAQPMPAVPAVAPPAVPTPVLATARLEPILFSYSMDQLATFGLLYAGGCPRVHGLGFLNLGWGATMEWDCGYAVQAGRIILSISSLRPPDDKGQGLARQFNVIDQWNDVGLGYYVELHGAFFQDYMIAKPILFLRTFLGDTPPPRVEKQLPIIFAPSTTASDLQVGGEWQGSYLDGEDERQFVLRLDQDGNEVNGKGHDISDDDAEWWTVRGFLVDSRLTFLRRDKNGPYAMSYVTSTVSSESMSGTWEGVRHKGSWSAYLASAVTQSGDYLQPTLPPEQLLDQDVEGPGPPSQADDAPQEADPSDLTTQQRDPDQGDRSIPRIEIQGSLAKTFLVSGCNWDSGLTCRITYTGRLPLPEMIFWQAFDVGGAAVGPRDRLVYPRLAPGQSDLVTLVFEEPSEALSRVVLTGSWAHPR